VLNNNKLSLDGEEGAGEGNLQNNASSANNENPVSGSVAPQPVVPSAVGLVTGGASAAGHQPPYDLRRKSPHHDPAAAAVAPNYPSGCNPSGSLSSNSASAAGPSGYATCMLPARKRPRRTCYTSSESMTHITTHFSRYPSIVYFYN
jgi:F-box protein 11